MVKYEFIYMKNKYIMESNQSNNDIIFHKYSSLINQDINKLVFLNKGKIIINKVFRSKLI